MRHGAVLPPAALGSPSCLFQRRGLREAAGSLGLQTRRSEFCSHLRVAALPPRVSLLFLQGHQKPNRTRARSRRPHLNRSHRHRCHVQISSRSQVPESGLQPVFRETQADPENLHGARASSPESAPRHSITQASTRLGASGGKGAAESGRSL